MLPLCTKNHFNVSIMFPKFPVYKPHFQGKFPIFPENVPNTKFIPGAEEYLREWWKSLKLCSCSLATLVTWSCRHFYCHSREPELNMGVAV